MAKIRFNTKKEFVQEIKDMYTSQLEAFIIQKDFYKENIKNYEICKNFYLITFNFLLTLILYKISLVKSNYFYKHYEKTQQNSKIIFETYMIFAFANATN